MLLANLLYSGAGAAEAVAKRGEGASMANKVAAQSLKVMVGYTVAMGRKATSAPWSMSHPQFHCPGLQGVRRAKDGRRRGRNMGHAGTEWAIAYFGSLSQFFLGPTMSLGNLSH